MSPQLYVIWGKGKCLSSTPLPRVYPVPFAREVLSLFESMKKSRRGQPELPDHIPTALETFRDAEWDEDPQLWHFAGLDKLYNYLRSAKTWRIPMEWKHVVPKSL